MLGTYMAFLCTFIVQSESNLTCGICTCALPLYWYLKLSEQQGWEYCWISIELTKSLTRGTQDTSSRHQYENPKRQYKAWYKRRQPERRQEIQGKTRSRHGKLWKKLTIPDRVTNWFRRPHRQHPENCGHAKTIVRNGWFRLNVGNAAWDRMVWFYNS